MGRGEQHSTHLKKRQSRSERSRKVAPVPSFALCWQPTGMLARKPRAGALALRREESPPLPPTGPHR